MKSSRTAVLALIAISVVLLLPGLFLPVLTIRGVLTRDGIAHVAPQLLEKGLSDETIGILKGMMNPAVVQFIDATGGDLRKTIIERLGPRLTAALQQQATDVPVYEQTRSIIGAVRRLYDVGSPIPATLILLFSVVVPFGKAALVAWALFIGDAWRRLRTLRFVEAIGKWSMACRQRAVRSRRPPRHGLRGSHAPAVRLAEWSGVRPVHRRRATRRLRDCRRRGDNPRRWQVRPAAHLPPERTAPPGAGDPPRVAPASRECDSRHEISNPPDQPSRPGRDCRRGHLRVAVRAAARAQGADCRRLPEVAEHHGPIDLG
jgi:hypothetical protein